MEPKPTIFERLRRIVLGQAKSVEDKSLFHTLSLIAFFAWVGLGADGLSSLCYGPEEAFHSLSGTGGQGHHYYLSIFVAFASVITVMVISAGYSQLIEAFPSGGGGYVVASKMLSPGLGAICGSSLLVDYVLTITISVASSADFIFSFLPPEYLWFKLHAAVILVLFLTLLNLRGVKESVVPLVPIFLLFVITHGFAIVYAFATHAFKLPQVAQETYNDISSSINNPAIGLMGVIVMILKAYSTGAGTYTGIEAVSNGLQILREPRVQTGKRTMNYMAISLAIGVLGLMLAYLLLDVQPDQMYRGEGDARVKVKTLNALLFERVSSGWGFGGTVYIWAALGSSAFILCIAAQAGFLGGPRVAANMALDSWLPKRFASLSDRFVTHNGVLLMGGVALVTLLLTNASVALLVVLYAINVFVTFVLSQAGMVRYWYIQRANNQSWRKGMWINGVGLMLCSFILATLVWMKFASGAWVTVVVTGTLVVVMYFIRNHYHNTGKLLTRLDGLVRVAKTSTPAPTNPPAAPPTFDPNGRTAVLLVNGFSGVGLHTLFTVVRLFSGIFKNFVFIQIGAIDAGVFKGADEIDHLRSKVQQEVQQYVEFMNQNGYYAECISTIGVDIVEEAVNLAPTIQQKFPQAIFFGGQLVFPNDSWVVRLLHNYTVFALQRKFYLRGIPFMILPIRV